MEDKKISEAVELLFKGAKMLAYHCPECKMPLFQHEGKIICPVCKKEVEIIGEGKNAIVKFKEKEKEEYKQEIPKDGDVKKVTLDEDLEIILKNAVLKLAKTLVECKTIDETKEIVEVLESLVNIIEKARRLGL